MKKWKIVALIVLCLMAGTVSFNRSELSVYAYTQEEKDAAKAWLVAHGYPPTQAGAEQAYQDYLNGKFDIDDGNEETPPASEEVATETQVAEEQAAEPVISDKVVATTEEVTTEETTAQETEEETTSENMQSIDEEITDEDGTEESTDLMSEESEETECSVEVSTESSSEEGFVRVGRFDGIIVVFAVAACTAMIFFTVRYIKKDKKDGE